MNGLLGYMQRYCDGLNTFVLVIRIKLDFMIERIGLS